MLLPFLLFAFNLKADDAKIALLNDSLKTAHDSLKFNLIEDIADELYFDGKLAESAIKYKEARIIEENSEYPILSRIATSYSNEAYCYLKIGYSLQALKLFNKSLNIFSKIGDSIEMATQNYNIGVAYFSVGDYNKSIEYYKNTLAIDTALNDTKGIGYDYFVIGNVYFVWKKYNEAIKAYKKSLEIASEFNDSLPISIRLSRIGETFTHLEVYDSALFYFNKSLDIEQTLQNTDNLVTRLNQIGNVYNKTENYTMADHYYKQARKLLSKTQQLNTKASLYADYGHNCLLLGKYALGHEYLLQSLEISKNINLKSLEVNNYQHLSEYYHLVKNYEQAYNYYIKYSLLKDSLFNETSQQELSKFQARFQNQEKEAVIKDLMQEQKLKDLQLSNEKNKRNFAFAMAFIALIAFIAAFYISQKIRSKNSELTTLNTTLKRMFSIISHDLRGAIASYQATGRIIKHHIKKNQLEQLPELADEVSKNSHQLSVMLDNLLNWSLSQIRNKQFEPKKTDIAVIIKKEEELYQPIAEKKKNCIVNDIKEGTYVFADSEHLQLIFRNLISNAIKFTENGNIELSACANNNHVEISIKDTGIGIDENTTKQIFELNETKVKRGTRNEKGTGLGLSLVKEYLEINKGSVSLKSEPGKGTEFIIVLPAINEV